MALPLYLNPGLNFVANGVTVLTGNANFAITAAMLYATTFTTVGAGSCSLQATLRGTAGPSPFMSAAWLDSSPGAGAVIYPPQGPFIFNFNDHQIILPRGTTIEINVGLGNLSFAQLVVNIFGYVLP